MRTPAFLRCTSLRARLTLAISVSFVLLVLVVALGLVALGHLHADVDGILERQVPELRVLQDLRAAGLRVTASSNELVLVERLSGGDRPASGDALTRERQLIAEGVALYRDGLERYERLAGAQAGALQRVRASGDALIAASTALLEANARGGPGLLAAREDLEQAEGAYLSVLQQLLASRSDALAEKGPTLHSELAGGLITLVLAGLVAALASAVLAVRLMRRIAAPIAGLTSSLGGTPGAGAPDEDEDEVTTVTRAVQQMVQDLRTTTVSRDFLDAVVTSMNDSLVVLDTDSNIVMVNDATCRLLGYREADLRGQCSTLLLKDESLRDAESTSELELLALLNGTRETDYRTSDGRLIPVSVTGSVLRSASGRRLGGILVAHDISERRRAHAELVRAKERAEAAARAKSDFLAAMSHEIRTPMNGVLGMTDLLLGQELGHLQRGHVETIRRSGETLLTLIDDILDFSAIESGELELSRAPFDAVELVEDVATLLAGAAHEKGLDLTVVADARLPRRLVGDSVRVRQVLISLVGNAIKFTEHGEVTVHVAPEAPREGEPAWRVEVKDTGIGIPADAVEHLFEPFSQVDSGISRRFDGTGLGLAISRFLLDAMGGEIGVRSVAGAGSTFWFTLPLEEADAAGAADALRDSGAPRVLAVSAHEATRECLAQLLRRLGAQCRIDRDASAALDWLRGSAPSAKPQCILVDHAPGEIDAIDFAGAVAREGLAPGARCVALCRLGDEAAHAQAWSRAGIDEHLARPVRASALRDVLSHALGAEGAPTPRRRRQPAHAVRVLLVEDHAVNRDVVVAMLEELGCDAAVEEDGHSALRRLAHERFDLVLMDCNLPDLDGFETTRRLRAGEQGTGAPRLPVVALTANTMRGERERCLAAGMDDYLSKPITRRQLRSVLESWTGHDAPVDDGAPPAPRGPSSPIDPQVFAPLQAAGNDFLTALIQKYAESWDGDVEALTSSLDRSDAQAAQRAAHRLKSASAMLGAVEVSTVCAAIESAAQGEALDRVPPLMDRLHTEYARALSALRTMQRKVS
jgi:PAS domain S-box-containing protein